MEWFFLILESKPIVNIKNREFHGLESQIDIKDTVFSTFKVKKSDPLTNNVLEVATWFRPDFDQLANN